MLNFDEEKHIYTLDGVEIPSVTTITQMLSNLIYKGVDKEILQRAAEKGTAVHKAIEDIEKWGEYNIEPLWQGFVDSYMKAKKELGFKTIQSELRLHNTNYAGTVDCIATLGKKTILIDFKTTTTIHNKLVQPQLSAYKILAENSGFNIDELYVLQLTKKGYNFKKIEDDITIFNKCLELWKYINESKH